MWIKPIWTNVIVNVCAGLSTQIVNAFKIAIYQVRGLENCHPGCQRHLGRTNLLEIWAGIGIGKSVASSNLARQRARVKGGPQGKVKGGREATKGHLIQTAGSIQLQLRHHFGSSYEVDQPGGKKIGHKLVEMVVEFVASAVQFGNFVVAKPPVSVSEGGVGGQRRKKEAQGTELVFLSKPQSSSS